MKNLNASSETEAVIERNVELLRSVNERRTWRHYKRTQSVWAKEVKFPRVVETLEGSIRCEKGDYLCKGSIEELWPQSEESLKSKYIPAPDSKPDAQGFREYIPRSDNPGVLAAAMDHDFLVAHPRWGTLHGKAGDYLVKRYEDKDVEFPEEVWIVARKVLESAYAKDEG